MRLLCAAFGSVLFLFTASFAGLRNTKCSSCQPRQHPQPTIRNKNSHSFPAPSCGQKPAGDSSKYRAWRLWCSQALRSRHLDLTEIPSNLQPHPVTMSLVHLALPSVNFLSYIRNKKARLQSDRLIAI